MKTSALAGILVILMFLAGLTYFVGTRTVGEGTICPADAQLCPDGSYVGRTGPNCEFAQCPASEVKCPNVVKQCPDGSYVRQSGAECEFEQCSPGGSQSEIGRTTIIDESGYGTKIVPLEILEDSRCAVDVTCVWAGRVVVRAVIVDGAHNPYPQTFELNKPITTETEVIELVSVEPLKSSDVQLQPSDYRLTFKVTKR
ncbi:MAG TPA: hypothetical protein VJB97_02700 [Candidatus Paceibacterota bacterium]